jgi:hypothetical protein
MLYFAYGSNLDCAQMRNRCPSARFRCRAMLPDHKLAFPRYSQTRRCGVADAVPSVGRVIWGVVYDIAEADIASLDGKEGYHPERIASANAYNRREVTVLEDGDPQRPLSICTYFATPQERPPRPNLDYKRQMVEGARFWSLPSPYIEELERIEVMP